MLEKADKAAIAAFSDMWDVDTFLEAMPFAFFYIGKDGVIKAANNRLAEYFSAAQGGATGKTLPDIAGEELYSSIKPHIDKALGGEKAEFHTSFNTLNGNQRHAGVLITPHLAEKGETIGCYAFIVDETGRKAAENGLSNLQEASVFKDRMLSFISHDLRSPISSSVGLLRLLLKGAKKEPLTERQKNIVVVLERSASHQLQLVENLVELSRIQRRIIEIIPAAVNPTELVAHCAALMGRMAVEKGVALTVNGGSQLAFINVDRDKMVHVINNILTNAIKYTNRGGSITVTVSTRNGSVQILVKDTGVGMDPKKIPALFEISARQSTLGTEGERGTGLGLAICHELVELNGGTVEMESTPGEGTTVKLSFPLSLP